MLATATEKPASTPPAVTVTEAKEKCKAAAIAHVESGEPIGDDLAIPFDVIQLLTVAGLTGPWFISLCKGLARRKQYEAKLSDVDALQAEAAEVTAKADKLEPKAQERIRKAKVELRAAEVAYGNGPAALRKEAASIQQQAAGAYRSEFNEDFMIHTSPYELSERRYKLSRDDPAESQRILREEIFRWQNVAIGKNGKDFFAELTRSQNTAPQQAVADALDPYSSY